MEKFKERVNDEGILFICLNAKRDETGKINIIFMAGKDEESLEEISGRFYIRTLNMEYVGSSRNLNSYIKKERKRLLQNAMKLRNEAEVVSDNETMNEIKTEIDETNDKDQKYDLIEWPPDHSKMGRGVPSLRKRNCRG